jgi:hypothetical protein
MMVAGCCKLCCHIQDIWMAYVAHLHFHRLHVGHRRALLRFGTLSRKHLRRCQEVLEAVSCKDVLPVISSGKMDSKTSLSSL